ncbi:hypothetical protein T440DRAFT_469154 [Plenodomus tracheiphilus IPT5]|uniref:Uncharacterized protein n=1 Tax=Plenodomus tracheiphilus IPT5 TaxID=1408161 RepID=A0A6A7B3I0_9PLEO|nr:hypothetical protein T440DRAFT_469154 [Plenodomus tracheiphilus IPT5]
MNTTEKIVWPTVAVLVLILLSIFRPAHWCRSSRKKESLLPVTHHHEPRPTFSERHLAHLRDWRQPPVSSGGLLPLHLGQPRTQGPSPLGMTELQIPTLARPDSAHQPQRAYKMTWQQFQDRQRNRDPMADEYHRHVCESWQPSKPRNYQYWKKYAEDREARKTIWEKVKDKWFKRFPRKDREIEFF